jgi:hypothetical protein
MKTILDKASIITVGTVAHLQVDIVIIYSVIYISPFNNDDITYMDKL